MLFTKAAVIATSLISLVPWAMAKPPELFFYPPGYRLPDGRFVPATLTNEVSQATTAFPALPSMSGIVVSIYWSRLCPQEGICDLNLIDKILRYWGDRNKKVVLSIPTVGFPMEVSSEIPARFETATPSWVLDKVETYQHATTAILNAGHDQAPSNFRFPSFIDPTFERAVSDLVHMLGRYDGDPVISQIRISTGFQAEDLASLDALKWTAPGMNDLAWVHYCRTMFELYRGVFHRTQIEFDLGRVSWIALKGTPDAANEADRLVRDMIAAKTFLAFDGLSPETKVLLNQKPPSIGPAKSLAYLRLAKAQGTRFGLEAAQPLYTKLMRDVPDIAVTVKDLSPDRLVLFGDAAESLQNPTRQDGTFSSSAQLRDLDRANAGDLLSSLNIANK